MTQPIGLAPVLPAPSPLRGVEAESSAADVALVPPRGPAPVPRDEAEFLYNSQDSRVMPAATTVLHDVGPGLSTPRVALDPDVHLEPVNGGYVYPAEDARTHSVLPFAAAARTVELFEHALGRPVGWAFRKAHLKVVPDGGEVWNAFYDRRQASLNFFHGRDPVTGTTVWSGDSGEVVAHETAHALLDAVRPRYMQSWGLDAMAFHEAFGDVLAMAVTLHDDRAIQRLLEQTGGDLQKPNLLAETGEAFGAAVNHASGGNVTGGAFVRSALNHFRYQPGPNLPTSGPPDVLTSEPHNFARVWTGAMYDVLVAMVERKEKEGLAPAAALRSAGEEMLALQARLFDYAPAANPTFAALGEALLAADTKVTQGRNGEALRKVLHDRRILPLDARTPRSHESLLDGGREEPVPVSVTLGGEGLSMLEGAVTETAWTPSLGSPQATRAQTVDDLRRLVAEGRIRYNEPGRMMRGPQDYFDSRGRPYLGYVEWRDGQMHVERLMIAS